MLSSFCSFTGYQHHFPYMSDELRLRTLNRLAPDNLYKGVVDLNNNKLLYVGMQDQWYTFTMFDAQAYFARDVVVGKRTLPDAAAQRSDYEAWRAREEKAETAYQQIEFQVRSKLSNGSMYAFLHYLWLCYPYHPLQFAF
eukprot:TRINITY_DN8401_c0_g1_i4.p1 TRINITY_DN8401_c0_g1~~TRINITY_DN8401_c0_g1_i4.p1  ORF type:complete len:140 (+),score=20.64 TRINITY_DN8401_c0_g1_i4:73-492(+)